MPQGTPVPQEGSITPIEYDSLSDKSKELIEEVRARFDDLTDSDIGGPFLSESAKFDLNRYALLLSNAVELVNSKGVVSKDFSMSSFPYSDTLGHGALRVALMIETVKHFIISYVELPDVDSTNAPMAVRRDYIDRWKGVLDTLNEELDQYIMRLDRELMSLGYTALLIESKQFPFGFAERVRPSVPPWWREL